MERVQVGQPELGRVVQSHDHVVHEREIGGKPDADLVFLLHKGVDNGLEIGRN